MATALSSTTHPRDRLFSKVTDQIAKVTDSSITMATWLTSRLTREQITSSSSTPLCMRSAVL